MRSFDPDDEYDRKTLKSMAAEPWMIAHLKLNPDYCSWGPGEDYMSTKGDGWGTSQELASWSAFGPWKLDELNECVHFYFEPDPPRSSARTARTATAPSRHSGSRRVVRQG